MYDMRMIFVSENNIFYYQQYLKLISICCNIPYVLLTKMVKYTGSSCTFSIKRVYKFGPKTHCNENYTLDIKQSTLQLVILPWCWRRLVTRKSPKRPQKVEGQFLFITPQEMSTNDSFSCISFKDVILTCVRQFFDCFAARTLSQSFLLRFFSSCFGYLE